MNVPQADLNPGSGPRNSGANSSTASVLGGDCGRPSGRVARGALSRCHLTVTTRPVTCAMAASRSGAWPGANLVTG